MFEPDPSLLWMLHQIQIKLRIRSQSALFSVFSPSVPLKVKYITCWLCLLCEYWADSLRFLSFFLELELFSKHSLSHIGSYCVRQWGERVLFESFQISRGYRSWCRAISGCGCHFVVAGTLGLDLTQQVSTLCSRHETILDEKTPIQSAPT